MSTRWLRPFLSRTSLVETERLRALAAAAAPLRTAVKPCPCARSVQPEVVQVKPGRRWYARVGRLEGFWPALSLSIEIALLSTAISLLIGSLCAYAIARLNFPFKNLLLALVLAIAMFPGIAIIGPLFREFNAWGLTNNYLALILPNVTFTLPICIWTLTAFFSELPSELEESARVDGCTRMQAFTRITVPLSAPGVFTAAILLFIQAWNEFLFARTFMSQPNRLTATVAIAQFEGADQAAQYPWGQITAASIVITLPLVLLVLLFQRRIISGLTAGAVKG